MPTNIELLQEAYKRGILPENKVALYEEAVKRGLIEGESKPVTAPEQQPLQQAREFQDQPDFMGEAVGEPGMMGEAIATPYKPLMAVLESPGAVSEAGLAERPEALEEKGASILDFAGETARGVLKQGGASEALINDITKREDFGDMADHLGRLAVEFGAIHPYTVGAAKIFGQVAKTESWFGKAVSSFDKKIATEVRKGFEKGIKPSSKLQKTLKQKEGYYKRATVAVKDIVKNKNTLNLTDELGEAVEGLPTSVKHLEEAAYQGKVKLFEEYSAISKGAEKAGLRVGLEETIVELEKMIADPVYQARAPDMIKYAEGQVEILRDLGSVSPVEAERHIKLLNESLESVYANPFAPVETARKAGVDKLQAAFLRKSLSRSVNNSKYQELKDTYGAYAHIERDISMRAKAVASKTGAFMDIGDVFSGYHALRGLLSWNPATLTAAVGSKGIGWYHKFRYQPDKLIKNMFKEVDSLMRKQVLIATPIVKPTSAPPPKQIEWSGYNTRLESGAPIPLRQGEQYAEYTAPGLLTPSKEMARSKAPIRLKTELGPAETPLAEIEKALRPDQIAVLAKRKNVPVGKKSSSLLTPSEEKIISKTPIKLKTELGVAEVSLKEIENALRPDQIATLLKRKAMPVSKKGMPLLTPEQIRAGTY